jgi:hypothetical protein
MTAIPPVAASRWRVERRTPAGAGTRRERPERRSFGPVRVSITAPESEWFADISGRGGCARHDRGRLALSVAPAKNYGSRRVAANGRAGVERRDCRDHSTTRFRR